MLLSGSKSYYDDYLRKKDTSRTLHDPPSLLTDRGAYVNFLEVQLERVSSACLSVQGYEERFQDMQSQLITLEEKYLTTNRMLALNQQCTEELKKIMDEKMYRMTEEIRTENWNLRHLLEEISNRITGIEYQVNEKLPSFQRELQNFHKSLDENKEELHEIEQVIQSNSDDTERKFQEIVTSTADMITSINTLETANSKLQFELNELTKRLQSQIQTNHDKMLQEYNEFTELNQRNLHQLNIKFLEGMDKLQVDVISREAGCLASIRLLGDNLREEVRLIQQKSAQELHEIEKKWAENLENELEKVKNRFMEHIVILSDGLDTQRHVQQTNIDHNQQHWKQLDRAISTISGEQHELLNSTKELKQTINRVIESNPSSHLNSPRDFQRSSSVHPSDDERYERQSSIHEWGKDFEPNPRDIDNRSQETSPHDEKPNSILKDFNNRSSDATQGIRRSGSRIPEESHDRGLNVTRQQSRQDTVSPEEAVFSGSENVPPNTIKRNESERIYRHQRSVDEKSIPFSRRVSDLTSQSSFKFSSSPSNVEGDDQNEIQIIQASDHEPNFNESPISRTRSTESSHRGKLKTPVTIKRSPDKIKNNEDSDKQKEEYIDYLGGGIYSDGGECEEEISQKRAEALGLTYIGKGLYVDPRGSLGRDAISSKEKPRKQSPSRKAPLPPSSGASYHSNASTPHTQPLPPEQMIAAFEKFLSKYREDPHRVDDQQQDSSNSLSWSDFLEDSMQSEQSQVQRNIKREAVTEYMKFQQQQQLNPWRPPSNLAQPMISDESRREITRPPLSPLPPSSTPSPAYRQQSTGDGRSDRQGDDASTITSITQNVHAPIPSRGYVDKIAPERRHFILPSTLVGSSATLKHPS